MCIRGLGLRWMRRGRDGSQTAGRDVASRAARRQLAIATGVGHAGCPARVFVSTRGISMDAVLTERERRAQRIVSVAMLLPRDYGDVYIAMQCANDIALHREVRRLLGDCVDISRTELSFRWNSALNVATPVPAEEKGRNEVRTSCSPRMTESSTSVAALTYLGKAPVADKATVLPNGFHCVFPTLPQRCRITFD